MKNSQFVKIKPKENRIIEFELRNSEHFTLTPHLSTGEGWFNYGVEVDAKDWQLK